jgi:hypothetical protein
MRATHPAVGFCAIGTAWTAGACASLGSARTLPAGRAEAFAHVGGAVGPFAGSRPDLLPRLELGIRYGVRDRVELDLSSNPLAFSATANLKLGLLRSDAGDGLDIAFAPGVGAGWTFVGVAGWLHFPLMASIHLGRGAELVLDAQVLQGAWEVTEFPVHPGPRRLIVFAGSASLLWDVGRYRFTASIGAAHGPPGMATPFIPLVQFGLGVTYMN